MSNQFSNKKLTNKSRRNFIKAAAYTSALSIGGISSIAFTTSGDLLNSGGKTTGFANGDISIMQQKMLHKETVSLMNNSDEGITLDAYHPVVIERINGSLVVKPNLIDPKTFSEMFTMLPRQRISFDIQTTSSSFSSAEIIDVSKLKGQLLHITSEHLAFNKLIPVTSAKAAIA